MKADLRRLLNKYESVKDFYIFGSFVKGRENPPDIDIAVVTLKKDYATLKDIIADLKKYPDIHAETVSINEIFSEPVWKSLLSEGFSVRKNRMLRDLMGLNSGILYRYDLRSLNRSQKTMFNRAYTGMIHLAKGNQFSPGAAIIPIESECKFDDFLKAWAGVKSTKMRILSF